MLWLALLHFIVLQAVGGFIFLVAHFPTKAANLDNVIAFLVRIEDVLVFPRWLALKLWPWEFTPRGMGLCLTLFNSICWGSALAAGRHFWRSATS